jgi:hypothetical protein
VRFKIGRLIAIMRSAMLAKCLSLELDFRKCAKKLPATYSMSRAY